MSRHVYGAGLLVAGLLLLMVTGCGSRQVAAGPEPGAASAIQNKGSDTLVNLALAWAEEYMGLHPEVRISVTGGGSGTGIAAIINGTADLANASREMKAEERAEAEANGIHPVEHVVAQDAIAVVVNPANPVQQLTLQQLSDIYIGKITNWREVGGEDRPIVLLARVELRHLRLLPRKRHPLGEQKATCSFPRYAADAVIVERASARRYATTLTPSATMGWAGPRPEDGRLRAMPPGLMCCLRWRRSTAALTPLPDRLHVYRRRATRPAKSSTWITFLNEGQATVVILVLVPLQK